MFFRLYFIRADQEFCIGLLVVVDSIHNNIVSGLMSMELQVTLSSAVVRINGVGFKKIRSYVE